MSQTSTAVQTSKRSAESRLIKGEHSYLPGGPVFAKKQRRKDWWKQKSDKRERFPGITEDILLIIVNHMGKTGGGVLSLIKLSMVNKWFREMIRDNPMMWKPLLPVLMSDVSEKRDRMGALWRNNVNLPVPAGASANLGQFSVSGKLFRPPNFKTKLIKVHDEDTHFEVARKAAILQNVPNCSMCGSSRYVTKTFWELNMKLCR